MEQRSNVQPDPIIDIGFPPYRLCMQRLPPNKNVVRLLAFKDLLQLIFQVERGCEPAIGTFRS